MTRRPMAVAAALAGLLVAALCACATPSRRVIPASPSSATSSTAPSSSIATPTGGISIPGYTTPPTPTLPQQTLLLNALETILPGVSDHPERAVLNARQVCDYILHPDVPIGGLTLNQYAQFEYEGGEFPDVTPEQADQIIAAINGAGFCVAT